MMTMLPPKGTWTEKYVDDFGRSKTGRATAHGWRTVLPSVPAGPGRNAPSIASIAFRRPGPAHPGRRIRDRRECLEGGAATTGAAVAAVAADRSMQAGTQVV